MMLEPKECCICGTVFIPRRMNIKACDNPECKRKAKLERQKVWYRKNYAAALEGRRNYMKRIREENKLEGPHVRKPDTIVAIGYAERQIAATLEKAGKVRTEL